MIVRFQLPLSGSPETLSHYSLSIIRITFNSLSRDHSRIHMSLLATTDALSAFNSLSRDHKRSKIRTRWQVRIPLSTPSLGITAGDTRNNIPYSL